MQCIILDWFLGGKHTNKPKMLQRAYLGQLTKMNTFCSLNNCNMLMLNFHDFRWLYGKRSSLLVKIQGTMSNPIIKWFRKEVISPDWREWKNDKKDFITWNVNNCWIFVKVYEFSVFFVGHFCACLKLSLKSLENKHVECLLGLTPSVQKYWGI